MYSSLSPLYNLYKKKKKTKRLKFYLWFTVMLIHTKNKNLEVSIRIPTIKLKFIESLVLQGSPVCKKKKINLL